MFPSIVPEGAFDLKSQRLLFASVATAIANATSYSSLINATGAKGSNNLKKYTFKVGDVFDITLSGYYTSTAASNNQIKITLGGITIFESVASSIQSTASSNALINLIARFTVISIGTNGSIMFGGFNMFPDTVGQTTVVRMRQMVNSAATTMNTTVDNTFDIQYKWGSAVGSINIQQATITRMRV